MAKRKRSTVCQVFLSHSTRDQWISERIKEIIEKAGASVWLDAFDLPGGRNVKERIMHVSKEDIPAPLRDLKHFDINEFAAYMRHLSALLRTK